MEEKEGMTVMTALRARTVDFEKRYTAKEFETLPEFNEGFELFDGRLVKKPMPNHQHTNIGWALCLAYTLFDRQERTGRMRPEAQVNLGPDDEPIPDVAFWAVGRLPARSLTTAAPCPDLVAEVWSPHDLGHPREAKSKIQRYLKAGVKLAWAINPSNQTVEVYHPGQANPVRVLGIADELTGEDVIPGFSLAVKALFE
jgi:Uma2 family endonuclease